MLLWEAGANIYTEDNEGDSVFKIGTRAWDPENPVREVLAAENDRRRNEAFAMVYHERLGKVSPAHSLTPEIVSMILTGKVE